MTVRPAQVAVLRSVLVGDEDAFERLTADLEAAVDRGFPVLIAAAFVAAARRRFPPGWSEGDVVRFVGQIRARSQGAADLSATAAEQLLFSALRGTPVGGHLDDITKGFTQGALLTQLATDLTDQELSTFLAEVREQADAWLAQYSGQ